MKEWTFHRFYVLNKTTTFLIDVIGTFSLTTYDIQESFNIPKITNKLVVFKSTRVKTKFFHSFLQKINLRKTKKFSPIHRTLRQCVQNLETQDHFAI